MEIPAGLLDLDTKLELAINGAHDPVLDMFFFWASSKWIWIPFYAWFLFVLYRNYGKRTIAFLPIIALMITASDQISTLLKNTTQRFRPCHDPVIGDIIHRVNNACGGQYGFVSSHAANTMAIAVFIGLIIPKGYKSLRLALILFVLINGYSRMYLGAHYPLDVFCGWMLGFILAILFSSLMKHVFKTPLIITQGHE